MKVVFFKADWCPPCQHLEQTLTKFASVTVEPVNVDVFPTLTKDNKIRAIPTLIIMKDGKEISRKVGRLSDEKLKEWFISNGVIMENAE